MPITAPWPNPLLQSLYQILPLDPMRKQLFNTVTNELVDVPFGTDNFIFPFKLINNIHSPTARSQPSAPPVNGHSKN